MSDSDKYNRSIDYNAQQTNEGQVQGASMNIEYDNVANALNNNGDQLDEIRRSDSTKTAPRLNNTIVSLNSLNADVLALITLFNTTDDPLSLVRGDWVTGRDYFRNDIITIVVTSNGIEDQVTITVDDGVNTSTFVTSGTVVDTAQDITVTGTGGNTIQTETEINVAAGLSETGTYICLVDHTSGVFLDDLNSNFWFQMAGNSLTGIGIDIAAAAAIQATKLSGTSTTSISIATGSKVFTTQADKDFNPGTFLTITSDADPTNFVAGQVTAYSGTTLTVDVNAIGGAGTFADWTIQVSGRFGDNASPRPVVIVTADLDVSAGFATNTFYQVRPVAEAQVIITLPDSGTAGFMDGFEASFHLDLAGSILVTTPTGGPSTPIGGLPDLVISSLGSTVSVVISTGTADYQISLDDRPREAAGVTLFATTFPDPVVAGYEVGVTDNDDVRYDDPSVLVTTGVIPDTATSRATAVLTTQFMADAGAISDLLNEDIVLTVEANHTPSNAKESQFFAALFVSVSPYGGANETLIKETAASGLITSAPTQQALLFSNVTVDIGATDRIVIKTFGWKISAGGVDPAIQFPVGGKLPGDVPARLKIPQSVQTISHNSTAGKQGGDGATEFFHMTEAQHAAIGDLPESYLAGLVLSNGTDTDHDIDIAVGECRDNADGINIVLASEITKRIDAPWAVGDDNGGLFSGSVAIDTWYHMFVIVKDSDGSIDAGFDTSISAANIPSGYTAFRRIGSVLTDGSSNIVPFIQISDYFIWGTPFEDFDGAGSATRINLTISTPLDVSVMAYMNVYGAQDMKLYLAHPDTVDLAPGVSSPPGFSQFTGGVTSVAGSGQLSCLTNTSSQVAKRNTSTEIMRMYTYQWFDFRGQL